MSQDSQRVSDCQAVPEPSFTRSARSNRAESRTRRPRAILGSELEHRDGFGARAPTDLSQLTGGLITGHYRWHQIKILAFGSGLVTLRA